jgi:ADP-ribose pyrophosphatase YjhB (NUDIX family)
MNLRENLAMMRSHGSAAEADRLEREWIARGMLSPDTALVVLWNSVGEVLSIENVTRGKKLGIVGGKIEPGEKPEDAAARELREESGLVAKRLVPLGVVPRSSRKPGRTRVIALYYVPEWSGELVSSDEGEVSWVPEAVLTSEASFAPEFQAEALRLARRAKKEDDRIRTRMNTDLGSVGEAEFDRYRVPRSVVASSASVEMDNAWYDSNDDEALHAGLVRATERIAKAFGRTPPPIKLTDEVAQAESAYNLDVLVNPAWVRSFLTRHRAPPAKLDAVLHWMLGHEMAHNLFFDADTDLGPYGNGLCSNYELRADFRAGQVMAMLGDEPALVEGAVAEVTPGEPGLVRMRAILGGHAFQRG